jgi:5'-3' exonuclease
MGIKGLCTYLKSFPITENGEKSFNQTAHLSAFKGKTIAIDFTNQAYRFLYRSSSEYGCLLEFINLIHKFQKYDIKIIFIFDGKPIVEKQYVIEQRKAYRVKLIKKLDEMNSMGDNTVEQEKIIKHLTKKISTVNSKIIQQCKKLFDNLEIPYIHINFMEADGLFKFLLDKKLADACFTADTDVIAYGCHTVLKDLNYSKDTMQCINFEKMLSVLGVSHKEFIYACILSGTDYNNSLKRSKFRINIELIKKYKTIPNICDNLSEINDSQPDQYKKSFPKRFNWEKVFELFTNEIPLDIQNQIINYLDFSPQISHSRLIFQKLQKYLLNEIKHIDKGIKYSRKFIEIVRSKFNVEIKYPSMSYLIH